MVKIYGQIDSLKQVKNRLHEEGITRFKSIADINKFQKTVNLEKKKIEKETKEQFEQDLIVLESNILLQKKILEEKTEDAKNDLQKEIEQLKEKYQKVKIETGKFIIDEYYYWFKELRIKSKLKKLERDFNLIIESRIEKYSQNLYHLNKELSYKTKSKKHLIFEKTHSLGVELRHIERVVNELNPLIAGAVGEHKVARELEKLPDDNILINDFSIQFEKPIYNRKTKDRIFSIQVDHLLINRSGVFIIETKNWSKNSIENLEMRSPIEQIQRTSYALFVLLNSSKSELKYYLKDHHWGQKKVPIKSIIAMVKNKPVGKFKNVSIKNLEELNGYINYFDPIFSDYEVDQISNFLLNQNQPSK